MAPFEFPKLNLSSEDPDLRYMALFDFARRISSHIYNESPGVTESINQLSTALCDRSESVRTQAMSVVGQVVKSCPYPNVALTLLKNLRAETILKHNSFSDLLQVYRDILVSIPMSKGSEKSNNLSISDQRLYCQIITSQLLPYLIGDMASFKSQSDDRRFLSRVPGESSLYDRAPSDSDRSVVLELVVLIVESCGRGLTNDHLVVIYSSCWAILQSDLQNLALRSQAVKAIVSFCQFASDDWIYYVEKQARLALETQAVGHRHFQKDCFLLLKGLVAAYPLKFVKVFSSMLPMARAYSKRQDFDPTAEEDELELYISSCEASMSFYDTIFMTYAKLIPTEEVKVAIGLATDLLNYDPGIMEGFDVDDFPAFDEDDDYEEEEGFGDLQNSSWRLRVAATKLIRTLAQSHPIFFQDRQVGNGLLKSLARGLKDRYPEVAIHSCSTVSALVTAIIQSDKTPASQSPIQRAEGTSPHAISIRPAPDRFEESSLQDVLDGVNIIIKGDSLTTKKAALNVLALMIHSQGIERWDMFSPCVNPILRLLDQAEAQSRRFGGTYAIPALAVVRALLEAYGLDQMENHAVDLVELVSHMVQDTSPAVITAALELVPVIVETFDSGLSASRDQVVDGLISTVLDTASSEKNTAAVRDYAIETLSQLYMLEINPARAKISQGLETILQHLSGDMSSQTSLKAITALLWVPGRSTPGFYSVEWIKRTVDLVFVKVSDQSTASRTSWFMLAKAVTFIACNVPESKEMSESVLKLASCALPFLAVRSSEDSVTVQQSLELFIIAASSPADNKEAASDPASPKRTISSMDGFCEALVVLVLESRIQDPHVPALIKLVGLFCDEELGETIAKDIFRRGTSAVSLPVAGRVLAAALHNTTPELFQSTIGNPQNERLQIVGQVALCELVYSAPAFSHTSDLPDSILKMLGSNEVRPENQVTLMIALGRACLRDPGRMLPPILDFMRSPVDVDDPEDEGYSVCIHSLAEFVERSQDQSVYASLVQYYDDIWKISLSTALMVPKTRPTAVRCMGMLMLAQPQLYDRVKTTMMGSSNSALRGLAVSIAEFWILHQPENDANQLVQTDIVKNHLLPVLDDEDIKNREYAILALNSISFRHPNAIFPILPQLLTSVLDATENKPEFVRQVRMGPLLRQFDDGMATRKGAYEILYTLVDSHPERLDLVDLFDRCVAVLGQDVEVRVTVCLILQQTWDAVFGGIGTGTGGPAAHSSGGQAQPRSTSDLGLQRIRTLSLNEISLLEQKRLASLCASISHTLASSGPTKTASSGGYGGSNFNGGGFGGVGSGGAGGVGGSGGPGGSGSGNNGMGSQTDQHSEQARRMASARLAHHVYTSLTTYYNMPVPSAASASASASARRMYQQRTLGLQVQPLVEIEANTPPEVVAVVNMWRDIVKNHWELAILIESGTGAHR